MRLATSGKSVCPFRSLELHLLQCTNLDLPLFTFSYGTYLTRQIFSDLVKSLLPQSCDKSVYSSHSFRIGAASCAADKQTPGWLIKTLGRWSSNCYEDYIRPPRVHWIKSRLYLPNRTLFARNTNQALPPGNGWQYLGVSWREVVFLTWISFHFIFTSFWRVTLQHCWFSRTLL